jgi:hypothetical protein
MMRDKMGLQAAEECAGCLLSVITPESFPLFRVSNWSHADLAKEHSSDEYRT